MTVKKVFPNRIRVLDPWRWAIKHANMVRVWAVPIIFFWCFACSSETPEKILDDGNAQTETAGALSVPEESRLGVNPKDATPGVLSSRSESAQEEQPKRKFYEDGQLKEEAVYAEGMKNGLFQSWFPNGQRKIRGTMENDRWNGSYEEWYEDGTPRIVGQYLLGKQHGEWRFFDKTGTPMPSLRYEEGLEVTRELPDLLP